MIDNIVAELLAVGQKFEGLAELPLFKKFVEDLRNAYDESVDDVPAEMRGEGIEVVEN